MYLWKEVCLMLKKETIDLNIILSFTSQYQTLYEQGKINQKQFDQILDILDELDKYSLEELKTEIENIFTQ